MSSYPYPILSMITANVSPSSITKDSVVYTGSGSTNISSTTGCSDICSSLPYHCPNNMPQAIAKRNITIVLFLITQYKSALYPTEKKDSLQPTDCLFYNQILL